MLLLVVAGRDDERLPPQQGGGLELEGCTKPQHKHQQGNDDGVDLSKWQQADQQFWYSISEFAGDWCEVTVAADLAQQLKSPKPICSQVGVRLIHLMAFN